MRAGANPSAPSPAVSLPMTPSTAGSPGQRVGEYRIVGRHPPQAFGQFGIAVAELDGKAFRRCAVRLGEHDIDADHRGFPGGDAIHQPRHDVARPRPLARRARGCDHRWRRSPRAGRRGRAAARSGRCRSRGFAGRESAPGRAATTGRRTAGRTPFPTSGPDWTPAAFASLESKTPSLAGRAWRSSATDRSRARRKRPGFPAARRGG